MTTRTRRRAPRFELAGYSAGIERFSEQVNQATYRQRAGLADEMGLEAIYAEHATLFADASLEALRRLADQDGDEADQARALLAFAVEERLGMEVADLTDRIEAAQSRAVESASER